VFGFNDQFHGLRTGGSIEETNFPALCADSKKVLDRRMPSNAGDLLLESGLDLDGWLSDGSL